MEFQDRKLPCRHAIYLCQEQRINPEIYIDEVYSIRNYRETYQYDFPPIIIEGLPSDPTCKAPKWIRLPGRPAIARKRSKGETRELHCSNCKENGHNRRRCGQARRHASDSESEELESTFGSETEAEAIEAEEAEEEAEREIREEILLAADNAKQEAAAEASGEEEEEEEEFIIVHTLPMRQRVRQRMSARTENLLRELQQEEEIIETNIISSRPRQLTRRNRTVFPETNMEDREYVRTRAFDWEPEMEQALRDRIACERDGFRSNQWVEQLKRRIRIWKSDPIRAASEAWSARERTVFAYPGYFTAEDRIIFYGSPVRTLTPVPSPPIENPKPKRWTQPKPKLPDWRRPEKIEAKRLRAEKRAKAKEKGMEEATARAKEIISEWESIKEAPNSPQTSFKGRKRKGTIKESSQLKRQALEDAGEVLGRRVTRAAAARMAELVDS